MAIVDDIFKENLRAILNEEWEDDNRATWEDGSPVQTKRTIAIVNRYDLAKEFPASTLRPAPFKTTFREVDWIYRKRSNNVKDFIGKIWNAWAFKKTTIKLSTSFPFVRILRKGSIGRAYGYQVAKPVGGYASQMDYILGEIKRNPTSRRLVIEMWNVDDLDKMNLPPCAHHLQFLVKNGKLNLVLKQRSNDYVVAGNFNVVEYAILVHMVARHTGLEVGTMTHLIGDCHIYNKHLEQAEELMKREAFPAPTLWINPEKTDFYSFTEDDFLLLNYKTHEQLYMEVAV